MADISRIYLIYVIQQCNGLLDFIKVFLSFNQLSISP